MEERQRINAQLNIYLRNESMLKDRCAQDNHACAMNSHMKENLMVNSLESGAETERSHANR